VGYESDEVYGKKIYNIQENITHDGIDYTITSIGYGALRDCKGLTFIRIPNTVTSIGEYAFSNCNSLTSVTIPNSITSMGDNAFSGCESLTSVTIPNSVISIGSGAFSGCSSLASVIIPNSVTSIGEGAFYNCSSLTSVIIPNSVTRIRDGAFFYCSNLKNLVCKALTPPKCDRNVFYGVNKRECTLYVPEESINTYKTTPQWNAFYNIETGIKAVSTSTSALEVERYTTDGKRITSPQKGINIIRMSNGTVKKVIVKNK